MLKTIFTDLFENIFHHEDAFRKRENTVRSFFLIGLTLFISSTLGCVKGDALSGHLTSEEDEGLSITVGSPTVPASNSSGSISFIVTYIGADSVNLTAGDITLVGDTAGCSVSVTNGTTTTPQVTISGCTGNGSVSIVIAPGTATDSSGNTADAADATDEPVVIDNTPPADPTGWALSSPSNGSTSNNTSPQFTSTGINDAAGGVAKVYKDASCTSEVGSGASLTALEISLSLQHFNPTVVMMVL
ncbi:MAG: hypothetical protein R2827_00145 [Bdellovibrionales bacterium]